MDWSMVLTATLFVGQGVIWVYTFCTGRDLRRYVELAASMLDTAADALDAWNGAYPSDAGGLMLMILDISKTAAASAEQLWINGSIGKDERKQAAIDYVCAALTAMGIELTDAIRKLIDGAIEAACLRTSRTALELTRPCSL